jgi:hypothetical protein
MGTSSLPGWERNLERWLAPLVASLRREEQRRWASIYRKGLILPGARKSIEPPRPSSPAAAAQTD